MVMSLACWGPRDIRFNLICGLQSVRVTGEMEWTSLTAFRRSLCWFYWACKIAFTLFSPKRWITTSQEIKEAGVCGGCWCAGAGREPTTRPRVMAGGLLPTGHAGTRTPHDLRHALWGDSLFPLTADPALNGKGRGWRWAMGPARPQGFLAGGPGAGAVAKEGLHSLGCSGLGCKRCSGQNPKAAWAS